MSKTASAEKAEKELGTPKRKFEVGQVTISDDGTTKSTVNNINKETGAISWTVENLPGFDLLYSELNDLVDISKRVYVKTKEDKRFRSFYEEVRKLRNSLRTHLRNEYPDDYKRILRIGEALNIPDPTSFADPDDEEKEQIEKITGPLRDLIKQFKLKKEVSMSGAAGSYLTPYAFRKKGQKADDEAYKQIGYKLVKEKLSIAGKEVEKIDKKGNDPENWVVKYKDGSEESYLKHLNEALNPFDRIDKVFRKNKKRSPKFKRGDEVNYLGTKAKVRSSKYNSFDKSFDYTVEYRDKNNQRTSADGVKDNDLKSLVKEAYSGFIRNPEDPDSEPFNPTGAVSQFREDLRALFGKFKGDLKNPEFIKGVAEIMVNWKSLLRSQLNNSLNEGIGNKINIARAKSHFKQGEKIAAINKKTKKVTKITGANQFGSFNPKEYDFAYLVEAEFKGKEVALNKPKRGGPKAYYVYVKDGDKVKKVTFGSGGLRAKIKNKEARNAFAKRHNCDKKKDRTKAGYWSCNLPRYAKMLGLGANMNTYW
jgi:hypothetical protein